MHAAAVKRATLTFPRHVTHLMAMGKAGRVFFLFLLRLAGTVRVKKGKYLKAASSW